MDLMKSLEGLEQNAIDALRSAERANDGVQLPFATAVIYWHNGQASQKRFAKDCPPLYYGGWATDPDKITELVEAGDATGPLDNWSEFEGAGDKGSYRAIASRTLTIATIASRKRWVSQDGKTSGPDYDKALGLTRQHLQLLALAYIGGKPWGHVTLTVKGWQVKYLADAITAWNKAIAPFRKELNATQIPLSAFAITLGTYGTEPNYVSVGQTATSKITPVQAVIPADLSAEKVGQRFIGAHNLRVNAERLDQAKEWLAAWKQGRTAAADDNGADEAEAAPVIPF